ncbi:MAG TPA: hypothetical protein VFA25_04900 [Actinomycetota bacterium]|nr:hypothetical protein [Actinomycetota bacterium]
MVVVVALIVGLIATLIGYVLPEPNTLIGTLAFGAMSALGVAVGYLIRAVHERDERLRRIEDLIDRRD